jgi:hypothetical protein
MSLVSHGSNERGKEDTVLTLLVRVPATIMMSDCRGEARKIIPSRSWSYLAAAMCLKE